MKKSVIQIKEPNGEFVERPQIKGWQETTSFCKETPKKPKPTELKSKEHQAAVVSTV